MAVDLWLAGIGGVIVHQVLNGITLIPLLAVVILDLLKTKGKKDPLRLGFTLIMPAPIMLITAVIISVVAGSPIYMLRPVRETLYALIGLFDGYARFFIILSLLYIGLALIDQHYAAEGKTNSNARSQQIAKWIGLGFMGALSVGLLICTILYIVDSFTFYYGTTNVALFRAPLALAYFLLTVNIIILISNLGLLVLSFPVLFFKNAGETKKTRVLYFAGIILFLVTTCFALIVNSLTLSGQFSRRDRVNLRITDPIFNLWPMVIVVCLICAMGMVGHGGLWSAPEPPMYSTGAMHDKEQQRPEPDQLAAKERHSGSTADMK